MEDYGALNDLLLLEQNGTLNPAQKTQLDALKSKYPNVTSTNGVPTFNFDYAAEATKAYGELGAYYDRILSESKGDLNLALARLKEDYDKGLRIKTEDTTTSLANNEYNRKQAEKRAVDAALARGLYQKSNFAPSTEQSQFGIPDTMLATAEKPYLSNADAIRLGLQRYKESADTSLARSQVDLPEQERRKEFALEQQRRTESANLANQRGQLAYQKFQSSLF